MTSKRPTPPDGKPSHKRAPISPSAKIAFLVAVDALAPGILTWLCRLAAQMIIDSAAVKVFTSDSVMTESDHLLRDWFDRFDRQLNQNTKRK